MHSLNGVVLIFFFCSYCFAATTVTLNFGGSDVVYEPLHPQLFDSVEEGGWPEHWFVPSFYKALRVDRTPAALWALLTEVTPGVYDFDIFTLDFTNMLMEEVAHYKRSGLPIRRPNSMNNYGLIFNEIGMEPSISSFQEHFVKPLSSLLFPGDLGGGDTVDHFHSFVVEYQSGADLGLDIHHDDSDVTLNICLGKEFTGSGLTFCGMYGTTDYRQYSHTHQHVPGRAVIHSGLHRHGADDIASGARYNWIVWNKSDQYRSSPASERMGNAHLGVPPDPRCMSFTHDHDYCEVRKDDQERCSEEAIQRRRRLQQAQGG